MKKALEKNLVGKNSLEIYLQYTFKMTKEMSFCQIIF